MKLSLKLFNPILLHVKAIPVLLVLITLLACNAPRHKQLSFYYWRTSFKLDAIEKEAISHNRVRQLYTRYFDVDFPPGADAPLPVAPIVFDSSHIPVALVPVIYIKNRVFERLQKDSVAALARQVFILVGAINQTIQQAPRSIQFDCDWTETTRVKYFLFLQKYKQIAGVELTATVRLHQVKYPLRTGIPPVDNAVLMYYNMGSIDTGRNSSIYEPGIAEKYTAFIRTYPLTLDIALPMFAWGILIRDGKVNRLLNKMSFLYFQSDSNFAIIGNNRFRSLHAGFSHGFYFKEGDIIKAEHVPQEDLLQITETVNKYSNDHIRNIIFFDLDKENIVLYDKNIYAEVLDHLN